jgi:purine nucleosidase
VFRCIIDCDPGVDDAMALWYGLLHPEIEIAALTTVWGNADVETTTRNALRILELADQPGIPVARGADKPLLGPPLHRGEGVHGHDGQGNTNLPPPTIEPTTESAAALLIRLAHEHPGELTLVPIGPLTNVAAAVLMDPSIARLYKDVVLMGGSFLVPGNVAPFGEANTWHDPEAAQVVLEAGWPLTIVGLDVTMKARLGQKELDLVEASGTAAGKHLHAISDFYLSRYQSRWGHRECAMHDPLALAIAHDPTLVKKAPMVRVDVELDGKHTRGMTVADLRQGRERDDVNARVVLDADYPRFLANWMEVICR